MGSLINRLRQFVLCILLCVSAATIASAQFKAGIQGTVKDSADAVVSDATVTLTSKETGSTQSTKTSDSGFYRFSSLAPGVYSVSVQKEAFKTNEISNVVVSAESTKGLDVMLEAGGISEIVTVTAENAPLDTEDANIRKILTSEQILRLPQTGRDPYELARLSPGVFGTGARGAGGNSVSLPNTSGPGGSNSSIFATENAQPITANGQRISSNNYQIDGTSVNSQTWGGAAVITPSQESVKEVVITSSTYSAEDGRNSGAQIKVISQNGTNQWHGSGFFKLNDPQLNAFNKFPVEYGGPQRVERKYQSYGGSLGGPIVKNRLFFFFAYEGTKENSNNTTGPTLIDTAAFRNGIIAARPGTVTAKILSSTGVEPRVVNLLTPNCGLVFITCAVVGNGLDIGSPTGTYGTYVNSNQTAGGGLDGIADLQYAILANPFSFRGNQFNTRIDFQATEKDRFTFSSFVVPFNQSASDPSAQSRPQADINSKRLSFALGFIYNRTLSATMTNEARVNLTRWGYDETKTNPDADVGLPRIEIEGIYGDRLRYGFPQGLNTPGIINEKQYDFRDTLTKVAGNHILKFGGEYRIDLNSNGEVGGARPLYSFLRPWNFANGTPIFEFIAADQNGKPAANNTKFTTSELAFFAQDDWKFRPNLTVNLGLRWSYYAPITASDGVIGNLLLDSSGGLAGAKITTAKQLFEKDLNNFAPQLGFAWSPMSFDNKLVIRGGAGIGYDRLSNALLANARRNPPNGALFNICCGISGQPGDDWSTPFVGGQISYVASSDGTIFGYPANPNLGGGTNPANGLPTKGSVEIYGAPQEMPNAYVMRYSLEGQYELPGNLVSTLGYQGSLGRHFVRILPLHIMTTTNPNIGAAYFASPDVNTSYNAMTARLQGRLSSQFSFDSNYRWSKSIDTSSFESPCGCTNQSYPVDQREERGPSDFDVTHALNIVGTWDVPFGRGAMFDKQGMTAASFLGGWQLSGILTWNGGFPWTPKVFGCLNGNTSMSNGFCDPRPTSYSGAQPDSNTNANFLRPTGVFGAAGTSIFGTAFNGSNPFQNPPGIGRNRFRGPRYFSLDMAFAKKIVFGSSGMLGENASLDLRVNFFNLLNNLNLAPFNSNSDPTRVQLNSFGRATTGLSGRTGELQVRFSF